MKLTNSEELKNMATNRRGKKKNALHNFRVSEFMDSGRQNPQQQEQVKAMSDVRDSRKRNREEDLTDSEEQITGTKCIKMNPEQVEIQNRVNTVPAVDNTIDSKISIATEDHCKSGFDLVLGEEVDPSDQRDIDGIISGFNDLDLVAVDDRNKVASSGKKKQSEETVTTLKKVKEDRTTQWVYQQHTEP